MPFVLVLGIRIGDEVVAEFPHLCPGENCAVCYFMLRRIVKEADECDRVRRRIAEN